MRDKDDRIGIFRHIGNFDTIFGRVEFPCCYRTRYVIDIKRKGTTADLDSVPEHWSSRSELLQVGMITLWLPWRYHSAWWKAPTTFSRLSQDQLFAVSLTNTEYKSPYPRATDVTQHPTLGSYMEVGPMTTSFPSRE